MKTIKKASAALAAAILLLLSVFSAFAEMIFTVDGFSFFVISNSGVSVCGWDNRSPELVLPERITFRYVEEIDNNAFSDNSEITSVDFSNTTRLDKIGIRAFENCTSINQPVVIPETVTTIYHGAFLNCTSLPSVDIKANINLISSEMFYGCSSLDNVTIPDSVTEIQSLAFARCTSLTYVELSKNINSINETAFYGCENLTLGVWYDSYAYHYAVDNNINYTLLDGVKLGDINGDDNININDVTLIQRHLAELEQLEGIYLYVADANQDSTVDIADATTLQMSIAEYELIFPIGEVVTK